jgi:hypothetical protein
VAFQVFCGRHLVALDPFGSGRGLLVTCSIKIRSHDRCKKAQQTTNWNVTIIYSVPKCFVLLKTPRVTQSKWGRPRDAHKWPTRNVVEHLWNIINTCFALSMPRITAVYECDNFPKAPKTPQISILLPQFYPAVMMFEEVHMSITLCTHT